MKVLRFSFGRDGGVKVEADGFVGQACVSTAHPIMRALGAVAEQTDKPEMHAAEHDVTLDQES